MKEDKSIHTRTDFDAGRVQWIIIKNQRKCIVLSHFSSKTTRRAVISDAYTTEKQNDLYLFLK